MLGLSERLQSSPLDLPRPYRRMVTLGSALVASPAAILFDEPTSGLDQLMIDRVARAIHEYNRNGGTSIIVSHNYGFVMDVADELIVLDEGKVMREASKKVMADVLPKGSALIPDLTRLIGWQDTILTEDQLIDAISAAGKA
jgi:energy-coupling factor transporter ATP-binding protein EcfA2